MPKRSVANAQSIPVDAFLADFPAPMRAIAERLRAVVRTATPDAIERVRTGWRLIGYDIPIGRGRTAFFAWVWLQPEHVHLGFTRGSLMDDRGGRLQGAGITKLARWLTFEPGDVIDQDEAVELIREAARTAGLPRSSPWALREVRSGRR